MKSMIALFSVSLALSTGALFAQSSSDEKISVGIGASNLVRSGTSAYGLKLAYKAENGLYVPISAMGGKKVQECSAGLGYKTPEDMSDLISYSAAAAISYLKFGNVEGMDEKDKKLATLLLQQELNFRITNKLDLGIYANLDMINFMKVDNEKASTTSGEALIREGYSKEGNGYYTDGWGGYSYPKYETDAQRNASINSIKKTSGTSVGVSLKMNIGRK